MKVIMLTSTIDDKATSPLLVGAFKCITDWADFILTDQLARQHLENSGPSEWSRFWKSFFQAALSPTFGPITPKLHGEDQTDLLWIEQIRVRYLQSDFVNGEQLGLYEEWCRKTSNRVTFMITNFWNADDERIPAAVVSRSDRHDRVASASQAGTLDAIDAAYKLRWSRAWGLMSDINKLPYRSDWDRYSPHSIGTFVVARSRQMKRSCAVFEMRVGPSRHYDQFNEFATWLKSQPEPPDQPEIGLCARGTRSKRLLSMIPTWYAGKRAEAGDRSVSKWLSEVFEFLEVPEKIVKDLLVTPHPVSAGLYGASNQSSSDLRSLLKLLEHSAGLGTRGQAELIQTLAKSWLAWSSLETFFDYLGCFIVWRYYRDRSRGESPPQDQIEWEVLQPSDAEMRLMLLNNLLLSPDENASEHLASHVSELSVAGQWDPSWFCHYCLPTWNKSASYLYVASKQPLSGASLICFQNLANHLIGLAWTHDSVRKQAENREAIIGNGERAARAAIMARNLSHNMGSHVLASIKTEPYDVDVRKDIDAILAFLQTRMDFIARITTDPPVWDQPLYFVKDIILPLISRLHVVVRNLVTAQWSDKIDFVIRVNDTTFTLPVTRDHPDKVEIPTDCAVMIPEGPCGAHAIYVLLENLLRNSVKYGQKDGQSCFQVYLALENEKPGYVSLRVWDNFGENREQRPECSSPIFLVDQMAEKYRSPLIDEHTGLLHDVDWGIQEIVTCARFLMHSEDRSHSDCVTVQAVTLAGAEVPNDAPNSFLCTRILLKRPCCLAVVSETISLPVNLVGVANGVERFRHIADLARSRTGYQMALIDMSVADRWPAQFEELAEFHQCLPYRLLAYAPDNLAGRLQQELDMRVAESSHDATCIPVRRIQVAAEPVALPQPNATRADWEVFLLRLHAVWIALKYHGGRNPAKGTLIVSFQRTENFPPFDRWEEQLSKNLLHAEAVNEVLNVAVLRTDSNSNKVWVQSKRGDVPDTIVNFLRENDTETTVVYDNHTALLTKSKLTSKPWMNSGDTTAKTFNALAHPSSDAFAFNSFLLALYEAGMGKVVVIDERVAEAAMQVLSPKTVESTHHDYRAEYPLRHDALNAANCYPQYSVRRAVLGGVTVHPICASHSSPNEMATAVAGDRVDRNRLPIPPDEGIDLDDPRRGTLWCRPLVASNGKVRIEGESRQIESVKPDFVIIHQGLIDTLFQSVTEDAVREWFRQLYRVAPIVVVTSGRGVVRKTRVLPKLPFVEFSVIKNALYPELCKPDLIATLASAKGVPT